MSDYSWYDLNDSPPDEMKGELEYKEDLYGIIGEVWGREMNKYRLSLYAGNDKTYVVYVTNKNKIPVDIEGGRAIFTFKKNKGGTVLFTKDTDIPAEGEIGAGNKGQAYFYISPADTVGLDTEEEYVFDVTVTISGKLYTVLEGVIFVDKTV